MSAAFDADDWAKEDCECGHPRYAHKGGSGECSRTVHRQVKPDLPEPVYAEGEDASTWGWPTNWPSPVEWPIVEQPCGCEHFYEWAPDEPWDY